MIIAIIQARMGSSRLPGKVLMEVNNKPLLEYMTDRIKLSKRIDKFIIATTESASDDEVVTFCIKKNIHCFRGSEDDVLARFYFAALSVIKTEGINKDEVSIVRLTADCPLIDYKIVDSIIDKYNKEKIDYCSNTMRPTFPDGLDAEVFNFNALEKAYNEAKDKSDREHVTPYIWRNSSFKNGELFTSFNYENNTDLSEMRWTVDEEDDFHFVEKILQHFKNKIYFSMDEILEYLSLNKELKKMNIHKRNEGGLISQYKNYLNGDLLQLDLTKSKSYLEKAINLIPGLSQTFSKGPNVFVKEYSPNFVSKASGVYTWDVDGNKYLDFGMALGPFILGYNYDKVNQAAKNAIDLGITFSLPHYLEVELAEKLVEIIPCAEMVRFGKNGSDATAAAVRASRAYTKRDVVACGGYHGWQDWYIGTTTRNGGVPSDVCSLTKTFEYNKIDTLKKVFDENKDNVACVILEPVGVDEPENGFLEKVKELCEYNNAILIFDEMISGFRVALGGAQERYNVTPDLATFGKSVANGYPISIVCGKSEIMQIFEEIFFSFTFGGEIVSISAALATIDELETKPVYEHMKKIGGNVQTVINNSIKEYKLEKYIKVRGLPEHFVIEYKDDNGEEFLLLKSFVHQEIIKRGILTIGLFNPALMHTEQDVEKVKEVYNEVLYLASRALNEGKLEQITKGTSLSPVFRKP